MVARRVLQRFVRTSPVLNLHARGRIVGTTGEHPFWVVGKGWVRASSLRIGDELASADGQKVAVEGIAPSGRTETVYNLEVEADHTYFVGEPAWHYSLWAHNAGADEYGGTSEKPPAADEANNAAAQEKEGQAAGSNPTAGKPVFENNPKHGPSARNTAKGMSSPAPTNGQTALDNSVQVKPTSPRRVGVDPKTKEIVVFDEHSPGKYHGHVRPWEDLHPDMQKVLVKSGQTTRKGKVL